MRLAELELDCYRRLGFSPVPGDTSVTTRIRAFINETQREILRNKHFRKLRRYPVTTTSTIGTPFMALPNAAVRVFGIQDRTNDYYLTEKDLNWIRSLDPALRATAANPWIYAPFNLASPVIVQPSDASLIFAKSSAAGDTTQTVFLEGVDSTGQYQTASVVLTGTTAVRVGTAANTFVAITKFYLSGTCVGVVTLNEDSGAGTVLATLGIGRTYGRWSVVHLYPVPTVAQPYFIDIEAHVEDMANAFDEPIIHEDFHLLLAVGARAKEYEKREKMKLMAEAKAEFREGLSLYRTYINQQSGLESTSNNRRFSQLGPWFENGT